MVQIIQFHPKPSLMTWRVAFDHLYPCTKPTPSHVMQWSIRPELVGVQIWWKYDHLPAPKSNTFSLAIRTLGWCFLLDMFFWIANWVRFSPLLVAEQHFVSGCRYTSHWSKIGQTIPPESTEVLLLLLAPQCYRPVTSDPKGPGDCVGCGFIHILFIFTPIPGENDPIWRAYFFRWLETPTSRMLQAFWQIEFSMYTPSF